jgi:DNA-binding MarR family transcriptional regulator
MSHWSDDLHAVFLELNGYMNRPDLDAAFLAMAGVRLDRALYPLLLRIGYAEPISVVDLAGLVGRDHSTVSRQVAKLEALGLVERQPTDDQRVRLLKPSLTGRKMLATFSKVRRRFFEKRLRGWTAEERKQLLALLQRLAASIAEKVSTLEGPARRGATPSGKGSGSARRPAAGRRRASCP